MNFEKLYSQILFEKKVNSELIDLVFTYFKTNPNNFKTYHISYDETIYNEYYYESDYYEQCDSDEYYEDYESDESEIDSVNSVPYDFDIYDD